ncbi:hypothetical protein AY600_07260 [Phormidium willei BDU 130791]|nr:hypothetical protein AY600_07260 [Phormidium willei BDU 130791]
MLETVAGSDPRSLLIAGALIVGVAFGLLARASGFCLRSALMEFRLRRPGLRALAWAAALLTAVAGTQVLARQGLVDLGDSLYLAPRVNLLALTLGGLLFGLGLVLARGCGARHLVLAAGGNLRSWVVLAALALVAYASLRGILAPLRLWLEGLVSLPVESAGGQAVPQLLAGLGGLMAADLTLLVVGLLAVGLLPVLLQGLRREGWRAAAWGQVLAGIGIGLLIPLGWYVTGVLAADDFDPVPLESLSFTAPVGDSLQYLMTYTGAALDFGIVAVGGTLLGAALWAGPRREVRLEGFTAPGQLLRYLAGAALMGLGGVLALGCTVGAGLSGVSTLSLGSMIALGAIALGARAALALEAAAARGALWPGLAPRLSRSRG